MDITSFVLFYMYLIKFKHKLVNVQKHPTNIEDYMSYICAEIILVIYFEKNAYVFQN